MLAVVAVLGLRHWFLAVLGSAAAYFLVDVPLLFLIGALLYRSLYVAPITAGARLIERFAVTKSSKRYVCTPVLLCRHGHLRASRRADRAMRSGRAAEALGTYLTALVAHPAGSFCGRVLSLRAAEAALDAEAPELAKEFAGLAVRDLAAIPILRSAVLAARGYAISALAASEFGDQDGAVTMLRRAQSTVHRNVPADRLVRLSAVAVRLASRVVSDPEAAQDALIDQMTPQEMDELTPYEIVWLCFVWARILHRRGSLETAATMYRTAGRLAGEHQATSLRNLAAGDSVSESERRMGSLLANAVCGLLECQTPDAARADRELFEEALAGLRVSVMLREPLTVVRLSVALEQKYGVTRFRSLIERHVDLRFAVFADGRLRRRWKEIRAGSAWPPTISDEEIEQGGARALDVARQLTQLSPSIGQRLVARVEAALRDEDPVEEARPTPASGTPVPVEAQSARRAVVQRSTDSYRPRIDGPLWLTDVETLTGGTCVTLRLGWQIATEMGHRTLGVEHLLTAALVDTDSAAAFQSAGVDLSLLRQTIDLRAGGNKPERATVAVEQVLRCSRAVAWQSGSILVRPWHVSVATLTSAPSTVHALLTAMGIPPDEVITRLVHGANNLRLNARSATALPQAGGHQLSFATREILCDLAASGRVIGIADVLGRVIAAPTTSPELRERSAGLLDSDLSSARSPAHGCWTRGLRDTISAATAIAVPWMRAVETTDLLDIAELRRTGARPSIGRPHPSQTLQASLRHAIALATAAGHSYVGPEHLEAVLQPERGSTTPDLPVAAYAFTPLLKRWLVTAASVAGGHVVEREHLVDARSQSGVWSGKC
ncbi:hypothetical protein OHB24_20600 [Kribbella sp. NBC_00482]|uniref:Clp protease N-terminal domain-containing protein n=1 Tax=Kribbella sp. NBC_00482 TaxID=2975968 RepID=UPI002E18050E